MTERAKSEESLNEQKKFAESLIENSAVATFVVDAQHRVVLWNRACEELTGTPASEIIGTDNQWKPFYAQKRPTLSDVVIDGNFGDLENLYTKYARSSLISNGLQSEGWYPGLNGRDRYIIFDAAPIFNGEGELVFAIETLQDITAQKKLEQSLKESEERLKTIIDTEPHCVKLVSADGRLIDMNPAGLAMFEVESLEQIRQQSILPIIAPAHREAFTEHLARVLGGESGTIDFEIIGLKGTHRWLSSNSVPFRNSRGEIIALLGITRDITEQRRLEEQLRQSQKMEAIGQLAGGVAHDFNNILSAIIGYGHLTLMKMKDDDPLRMNLEQILEASERAAALTHSLLAFSRKQTVLPRLINVNDLVRKFEKFLFRLIREDIEFKTSLSDSDLRVMADSGHMEQVLMNLVTNATDAMPKGGRISIKTERVSLDPDFVSAHGYGSPGEYALITVEDTGAGMDQKTMQRIFEPFFTTKEQGKGTGLGLAMVYGIVKQHDGYINVYSELGVGTVYKIFLPIAREERMEEGPGKTEVTPIKGGTETVLLAEDDDSVRNLTKTTLTHYGYTVIEASDGEDALMKYIENKETISLAILDAIMPRRSGKDVYDEMKKVRPDMKVIFVSGYTADIFSNKGVPDQGIIFISKPVSPSDLLRKVRDILDA